MTAHYQVCYQTYEWDFVQVAAAVAERLSAGQDQQPLFPALQFLGRGIKNAVPELRSSIRHCIEA